MDSTKTSDLLNRILIGIEPIRIPLDLEDPSDYVIILDGLIYYSPENNEGKEHEEIIGAIRMIFIDANKSGYADYLTWAEKHIKKGGLIVADNTLISDAVWKEDTEKKFSKNAIKSMQEFNLRLADKTKYTSIMLPIKDGFSIAIKNF